MGVVDEEYILKTSDTTAMIGRKVPLEADEIAAVIAIVEKLGKRLYEGVIGPRQAISPATQPEPPEYTHRHPPLDGLEPIDSLVLESACQTEIANGLVIADSDSFLPLLSRA